IAPRDRAIITKAKNLTDCFLWMSHSSAPVPADPQQFEDVAGCFEAVADGLALLRQVQDHSAGRPAEFEPSLDLLAEAESTLGQAVAEARGEHSVQAVANR